MSTAVLCRFVHRHRGAFHVGAVTRPSRADGHDRRVLPGKWGKGKRGLRAKGAEDPACFPGKAANLARLLAADLPGTGRTVEEALGLPPYGARRRGA